jgi:hypothetical protein
MSQIDKAFIENFMHEQIGCWNAGDRDGFFAAYRRAAPNGLSIEYVGRPVADGWPVLEGMWVQQNAKIEVDELVMIINGSEAALHNRNKVRGTTQAIDTIELYRFEDGGHLTVRYFVLQP